MAAGAPLIPRWGSLQRSPDPYLWWVGIEIWWHPPWAQPTLPPEISVGPRPKSWKMPAPDRCQASIGPARRRQLGYNSHIGHRHWSDAPTHWPFKVGWGTRSAYSSTSASMGSSPGLLRPGASIVHPFLPALGQEPSRCPSEKWRQSALAASSTLPLLFGTRWILYSPSAVLGTNWKLSFFQNLMQMQINFFVALITI